MASAVDHLLGIDLASSVPRHRQVYDALRTAILVGRLRPGDRLPATRTLAEDLAVSRTTIAEAYEQLQSEGYIQGKHGSGTFVAPNLPEEALHAPRGVVDEPAEAEAPSLSQWGRHEAAAAYRAQSTPLEPGDPDCPAEARLDFRPHRIAADSFPWDAWRAAVDRALSEDRSRLVASPPIAGHPTLRAAIADHVSRFRAVRCRPEQVVVVNGTQQGLNLLAQLLLDPGDAVAVEDPGYPAARLALQARGLRVQCFPVDGEGLIVDRLAGAGDHRLVHVTPSHQDPTGATLSLTRRIALLEEAERSGFIIFEDDYDSEFRYEGRPVESLQGLDRHGLVVYAGTFSKSLLAGLRIGFLVLPGPLVEPFVSAKSLWDGGTPMLEQAALAQFIRSGDFERHIRRMRRLYRKRRDVMVDALHESFGPQVRLGEQHGGLNLLISVDLPSTEETLLQRAASAGIVLRPAAGYFMIPPEQPTFLLGFAALDEDEIRRGVAALRQAW